MNLGKRFAFLAEPENDTTAVRNYLTLRKLIGGLGIALPLAMWLLEPVLCHGAALQPTISDYYYTLMRDLFVGILCAIGVFLVCYRGTRPLDYWISLLAGLCAIGIGLFPTAPRVTPGPGAPLQDPCVLPPAIPPACWSFIGHLHITFAIVFFLAISVMAFFLFKNNGKHAKWTNPLYKLCGLVMFGCIFWMLSGPSFLKETIAVEAFGIAWLLNGIGGLKHPDDQPLANGHPPAGRRFA